LVVLAGCGGGGSDDIDSKIEQTKKIKKTGQIKSYDENGVEVTDNSLKDDGFYKKGVTPSYTRDDANEVVVDNLTNLMWQDNDDAETVRKPWLTNDNFNKCVGINGETQDTSKCFDTSGDTASSYCSNLNLAGFTDWRLPTKQELENLFDYSNRPSIASEFKNTRAALYQTSDSVKSLDKLNWLMNFDSGTTRVYEKRISYYHIRCVRNTK